MRGAEEDVKSKIRGIGKKDEELERLRELHLREEEKAKSRVRTLRRIDDIEEIRKIQEARQREEERIRSKLRSLEGTVKLEDLERLRELRLKEEEAIRSKARLLTKEDVAIEELQRKHRKLEEELGEVCTKSVLEPYDILRFGPLVREETLKGYRELKRYYVENPYSLVRILQNNKTGEMIYHLQEPQLSETERKVLNLIWEELRDTLPYERTPEEKEKLLGREFLRIANYYGLRNPKTLHKFLYYLIRDTIGYGKIDALIKDRMIEDISCDGVDIPVYVYHREFYNLRTNVTFTEGEIDTFVTKLSEKCGRHLSYAEPVLDATLPDGSRLQATLGREVTTRGSSFTIRKFMGSTFTPVDLLKYGTFNSEMLATLWMAAENGRSMMIVGGTGSGKTSTLNALAFFIPPDAKIVSIEDTRELSLYQENWLPNLTRETGEGKKLDMYELVRQAMRQRPECIIVGEVRGVEALAMFQAMSTGHTAFSTMHAGSVQDAINRLLGEPINLPPPMLAELDIMCLQVLTTLGDKRVRRNRQIVEFLGLDPRSGKLRMSESFSWVMGMDSFIKKEEPNVLREIREERGMSLAEMVREIDNRCKLLEGLAKKPSVSYGEVASYIRQYYTDPEGALKRLYG